MEEKNGSKTFWMEALTGGVTIGVVLFVWGLIGYWFSLQLGSAAGAASFVSFAILLGGIILFSRRMRELRGRGPGYPYGTAFGFILALMLFTGITAGIGQFFLEVVIAPDYFDQVREAALLKLSIPESSMEQMIKMYELMKNPLAMIFASMLSYLFYGGLMGLIVAIFLKRPADPFAGRNEEEEYNPQF